jgi:hypothetical protein
MDFPAHSLAFIFFILAVQSNILNMQKRNRPVWEGKIFIFSINYMLINDCTSSSEYSIQYQTGEQLISKDLKGSGCSLISGNITEFDWSEWEKPWSS